MKVMIMGDIHFGRKNVPTLDLVNELNGYLLKNRTRVKNLDIIILNGDIFDGKLSINSDEYNISYRFLLGLGKLCYTDKIKLRILEGTASHDWRQCQPLCRVFEELLPELNFKYWDKLGIEEVDKNFFIGHIPDNWSNSCEITKHQFEEELNIKNIDKVNLLMVHGQFKYQLPNIPNLDYHDKDYYSNVVDTYIVVSHIHTHNPYDKIIPPGSFSRISHNEQEPKGAIFLDTSYPPTFEFIENKLAREMLTIIISDNDDTKKIIKRLTKLSISNKHRSVRLKIGNRSKDEYVSYIDMFPTLNIDIHNVSNKEKETIIKVRMSGRDIITKDNIVPILLNNINKTNNNKYIEIMEEHI